MAKPKKIPKENVSEDEKESSQSKLIEEMTKYYRHKNSKFEKPENKKLAWWVWLIPIAFIVLILIFYGPLYRFLSSLSHSIGKILMIVVMGLLASIGISQWNLIKSGDKESFDKDLIIILAVLQVLLLFLQVVLIQTQTNIQSQQEEILNRTSQNTFPSLRILILPINNEGNILLNRHRISSINGDNSTGGDYNIYITNSGKMDTGGLRISVVNNWSSSEGYISFQNIPSGGTREGNLLLTTPSCANWHLDNEIAIHGNQTPPNRTMCTSSGEYLPIGNSTLNLQISCVSCNPQTYYLNLSSCLYDNYKYFCDGSNGIY